MTYTLQETTAWGRAHFVVRDEDNTKVRMAEGRGKIELQNADRKTVGSVKRKAASTYQVQIASGKRGQLEPSHGGGMRLTAWNWTVVRNPGGVSWSVLDNDRKQVAKITRGTGVRRPVYWLDIRTKEDLTIITLVAIAIRLNEIGRAVII